MTMPPLSPPARRQRGFTLVELLVSMTIGLVMIAALGIVMNRFESNKRRTASSSDLALNTGYIAYDLDRQLRSAGSGIFQIAASFGCVLSVSAGGAQLLPATASFPAPFQNVPTTARLIPLVAYPGIGDNGSDVIQVMTGSAGVSEAPLLVSPGSVTANTLLLANTLGIRGGDLMLLTKGAQPCMMIQAAAGFAGGTAQLLQLDGPFQALAVGPATMAGFNGGTPDDTYVTNLGNQTANTPRLMLLGINASQQLVNYDLLRLTNLPGAANTPVPLADGVVDLRVRYGIENAPVPTGTITGWVTPTGNFSPAFLNNGTVAAATSMRQIMAMRVAMVLRGDRFEKDDDVSPATLTMFQSLPGAMQQVYNVPAGDERKRAYRLVEFTVPLRNTIANAPSRPPIP